MSPDILSAMFPVAQLLVNSLQLCHDVDSPLMVKEECGVQKPGKGLIRCLYLSSAMSRSAVTLG